MTRSLSDITQSMIDAALKAGADSCDALAVDGTSVSISVLNGALEHAERSEGIDIGLRVLVGQKQANVSSSDVNPETISEMSERAVAMAKEAPDDPNLGLADASQLATSLDTDTLELFDPSEEPDPAQLQDFALRAEAAALKNDGISQVQSASAGYGRRRVHMTASNGFSAGYARTDSGLSCVAISGEGTAMERDYDYDSRVFRADMRNAEEIGTRAAARAVERYGARKPKTGAYPVLFDERIASSLVGHLLQAVNGAAIARGSSWLRDALGEQVLPKELSIIEDPHRVRAFSSRLFDAEGLPTQRRAVVKNGVLQGWTLDLANARKLGMDSTASAVRGTGSPPSPGLSNIALTQGDKSRSELLFEMGTGLLITSMIGSTINPNTGDYSRGASGFWVENGEITYPVNECTVAGNLRDMLMNITPANDAQPHLSRVVPSILVEGLTLAGE
ncbi:PmbA protein [Cognatiyoonia sediminum]|uniref:PmbA protein n=1 Tax=Cognatiyoonia sediminum TaxID=1508389 RepID=A0A1M5RB58_9RHOB|nr:TldD/PmbA family protein [Cognatiyoonia sediminum]SHH23535.1 PmbA protein [Cognatiyoonia sediminum]